MIDTDPLPDYDVGDCPAGEENGMPSYEDDSQEYQERRQEPRAAVRQPLTRESRRRGSP